jgi:hypothetical protein
MDTYDKGYNAGYNEGYVRGYAHAWMRTRKDKGPGLTMNADHCSKDGGALLHPDREASQGLIERL